MSEMYEPNYSGWHPKGSMDAVKYIESGSYRFNPVWFCGFFNIKYNSDTEVDFLLKAAKWPIPDKRWDLNGPR